MLTGKIRCGNYWNKVPGLAGRALCAFCKKKRNIEVVETEQHMWLECNNSGQALAWETSLRDMYQQLRLYVRFQLTSCRFMEDQEQWPDFAENACDWLAIIELGSQGLSGSNT